MPDDYHNDEDAADAGNIATEALACVSCRSRKLKCDRISPVCTRCAKVNGECVYPESRRKPTFKRRNVKELEARLAQVEGYLKDISKGKLPDELEESSPASDIQEIRRDEFIFTAGSSSAKTNTYPSHNGPKKTPDFDIHEGGYTQKKQELMWLGQTESLPPFEAMEDLNNAFFGVQYHHIPIIHAGRYYEAFYGSPLRKPPMCLQYAIWALGSLGHSKYDDYADVFYKRSRQYLEADEMKGDGEHFITLAHAQASALLATYEARTMLFTRAAMSCARSVRLTQMMGLDRLDGNNDNLPPALGPTQSWIELEERRRTLWGTFAIDCHASISTGWPNLLISSNIRTRLPASEAAFASGEEEIAPFLEEAIKGAHYSSFAGTIVVCEAFKGILNHIHREHSEDHPEDLQSGKFWQRHRELDNNLSSTFMFLPEAFRLPQNVRDPAAIYANLNLHASVICLHHASLEMAEKHNLSDSVRKASITRLKTSAEEIVNIVKLTSHHTTIFRSPLCSLALYCATTVFIYLAKESGTGQMDPMDVSSLDIVIRGMQAISRHHKITNAFLQQAFMDIERNGLSGSITMPWFSEMANSDWTSNIPMLARSVVSRHTNVAPVLPGRLPLNNPQGKAVPMSNNKDGTFIVSRGTSATVKKLTNSDCYQPMLGAVSRNMVPVRGVNKAAASAPSSGATQEAQRYPANKRKRTGPSPAADSMGMSSGIFDTGISTPDVMDSSRNGFEMFVLPDRSTSSNASSPAHRTATSSSLADVLSSMSGASPVGGLGNTPEENRVDFSAFQDKISGPIWSTEEEMFMKQMADSLVDGSLPGAVSQPWDFVTSDMPWQPDQQLQ